MIIKSIGVVFIVGSCACVGFKIAANYKKEEKMLCDLVMILEYMISELQYRLTPLPLLCRQVSQLFPNALGNLFKKFSDELDLQKHADPGSCMATVLKNTTFITPITRNQIITLCNSVGRFGMEGQLKGLNTVQLECERQLSLLRNNRDSKIRSYQTLGLCAGAALAILLI